MASRVELKETKECLKRSSFFQQDVNYTPLKQLLRDIFNFQKGRNTKFHDCDLVQRIIEDFKDYLCENGLFWTPWRNCSRSPAELPSYERSDFGLCPMDPETDQIFDMAEALEHDQIKSRISAIKDFFLNLSPFRKTTKRRRLSGSTETTRIFEPSEGQMSDAARTPSPRRRESQNTTIETEKTKTTKTTETTKMNETFEMVETTEIFESFSGRTSTPRSRATDRHCIKKYASTILKDNKLKVFAADCPVTPAQELDLGLKRPISDFYVRNHKITKKFDPDRLKDGIERVKSIKTQASLTKDEEILIQVTTLTTRTKVWVHIFDYWTCPSAEQKLREYFEQKTSRSKKQIANGKLRLLYDYVMNKN